MPHEEILYSAKGPVGYLTLNNPKKINVLSKNMIGEIIHALDDIAEDESIKVSKNTSSSLINAPK